MKEARGLPALSDSLKIEIDPENAIDESNTDNNKAVTTFSIDQAEDDDDSSTMRMIAVAVGVLVVGFVYISYRSRR